MARPARLNCFLSSAICGLMLAGCAAPKATRGPEVPDPVKLTSFWKPYLLYLLPTPYSKLYIEVDAVEGCVPSESTLNQFREFLKEHCNKPDGIEIVRSDVIPRSVAKGATANLLSQRYLNGPPAASIPSPAYMYVLFYDGVLSEQTATPAKGQLDATPRPKSVGQVRNPHADLLPYPVIFINTRYGPKSGRELLAQHEGGHLLGLAGRETNAANYHCLDKSCLMHRTITFHLGRWLLGRNPFDTLPLCANCQAQLAESAKQPPPENLRYVGPVLVRSEPGYQVLSLPERVKLVVGRASESECRDFAATVRAEAAAPGAVDTGLRWFGDINNEIMAHPETAAAFARAKTDPFEPVRNAAAWIWNEARVRDYYAKGQFAEAVGVYRQAIQANPEDDWIHNQVAWILATCPDPTVRDGKAAVAAASKACELSHWANWNWIDTLAAAYAEMGDFKRATEFQARAIKMGKASESEQQGMRERESLYRESRPYRENR